MFTDKEIIGFHFFFGYILLAIREEIVMTKPLFFAGDVSKHRIEHAVSHISTTFVSMVFQLFWLQTLFHLDVS